MSTRRTLRRVAFGLVAVFSTFAVLMTAGATVDDPGGLAAVGLIATWLVPLVVLVVLARRLPDEATIVLAVLAAGLVAMHLWAAADPSWWRQTEDGVGPIRAVVGFLVMAPMATLGLRRPAAAGTLLLVSGLAPMAVSWWAPMPEPIVAFGVPAVIAGVLFVVSVLLSGRAGPDARSEGRRYPRAA